MEKIARPRLFYLDLIRAIALICILIIHFNAAVTGYFTYPSKLFGSVLPFGIYLGDFGSSLFFMVSGAALAYTAKPQPTLDFYKKRAKAIYPMFWLAWAVCFSIRFVAKPWYYAGAKAPTLLFTALGLDQFAVAANWVSMDYACVGEWFLGSILFLYLLFPLLLKALRKNAGLTWLLCACLALPLHWFGVESKLLAIHLLEFMFGMTFVMQPPRFQRMALPAGAVLLLPVTLLGDTKLNSALLTAAVFALLAWVGPYCAKGLLPKLCALLGKYAYAVFLVHHVIILRLVEGFDLAAISRTSTVLLFGVYLLATGCAARALYWADGKLQKSFAGFLHAPQ